MDRNSLERRIKYLSKFKSVLNRQKKLKKCSDNCIEVVCEACYNILRGKIKLSNNVRKKLKKHKKIIRQLANPKPKTNKKRQILMKKQVSEGLFPVIIEKVLPYLIRLLKNKNVDEY